MLKKHTGGTWKKGAASYEEQAADILSERSSTEGCPVPFVDQVGMIVGTVNQIQQLAFAARDSVALHIRTGVVRAILFALLWWILTEGAIDSWLVGAPAVLLATLASVALQPPFPWSLTGIVRFVPFFLWHSLCGGADVAWRAFQPKLQIVPEMMEYPLQLPSGLPRVFMANTVSLLPGTLSAELCENRLKVHVLDTRKDVMSELMAVEQSVARIFGTSLQSAKGGDGDEEI